MAKNDKTKTQPPDMRSRAPQFSGKMPVNKSNPAEAGLQKYILGKKSALGELRCTTSSLQTVLLTFLHTRIAGQEASLLQDCTVLIALLQQGAAQAAHLLIVT